VVYRAVSLKDATEKAIVAKNKDIKQLQKNVEKLSCVLEALAPIHRQYEAYRLFMPRYRTWKKAELQIVDGDDTMSENSLPYNARKKQF